MSDESVNTADLVLKRIWQGSVEALLDPEVMSIVGAVVSVVKPKHVERFKVDLDHLLIPVRDGDEALFDHFERAFNFIEARLAEGKNVLVHCMAGRSRSSALLIAYMLDRLEFVSYDQALAALRAVRPSIALMPNYEAFLRKYEGRPAVQSLKK